VGQDDNTLEVEIERLLPGGLGLSHAPGQTILVSLAAPGDHLRVRIVRKRGKVAFASIIEILRPSPVRIEPPCPYFGRCGGCDFQQLQYEAQLRAKVEMIRDCLQRIARIEKPPDITVVPSPKEWHYRSRASWQVDAARKLIGYYERGTHLICDIADCAVLVPDLQETLESVRSLPPEGLPQDRAELEVVAGDDGISLTPELDQFHTRTVTRRIGNDSYQFSATSFFQSNHDLLDHLIATVIEDAQGQRALDLYCGVGLFTIPLARKFSSVVAIESNPEASRYARLNLSQAGLDQAKVVTARAGDWLAHHAETVKPLDFLLLDPPRTGAEPRVIENIVKLRPLRIAYVSCDPATLARDLQGLLNEKYFLESLTAFDLFPQTHHVETVVQLKRRG
jgi:23S rRNA (uracil1939-C5)-methyltransferase